MEPSQFLTPAVAMAVIGAIVGLIVKAVRLQTKVDRLDEQSSEQKVAIAKIDGKSPRDPRRPEPLAPGKHSVEISFSSARAVVGDDLKTIEIDVQPCKRYRVVAQYHTSASGKWDPVVSAEDIGECKKKFLQGQPATK